MIRRHAVVNSFPAALSCSFESNYVAAQRHIGADITSRRKATSEGAMLFRAFTHEHNKDYNGKTSMELRVAQMQQHQHRQQAQQASLKEMDKNFSKTLASRWKHDTIIAMRGKDGKLTKQQQLTLKLRRHSARERSEASTAAAKSEIRQITRELRRVMSSIPDNILADPEAELKLHDHRQQLQGVMLKLQQRHFLAASTKDLLYLLFVAANAQVPAASVLTSCATLLRARMTELNGGHLVAAINGLCTVQEGLDSDTRQLCVGAMVRHLLENGDRLGEDRNRMSMPSASQGLFSQTHPNAICKLLTLAMEEERNTPTQLHCVPRGIGKELLSAIIRYYNTSKQEKSRPAPSAAAESQRDTKQNAEPINAFDALQPSHVVVLCRAVVHYGVPSVEALTFLADAAPLIANSIYDLSGRELSHILLAYATIGYRNTAWFLAVGQRAGDLGETLREDDAARIIRAFELTDISFGALRNSLESSMRLRHVRRKVLSHGAF